MSEPRRHTVADGVFVNVDTDKVIRSILVRAGLPPQVTIVLDEPLVVQWGVSDELLAAGDVWMRGVHFGGPPAPDPDAFTVDGTVHVVGDSACSECWSGYPETHRCGGLLHAVFYDESYDPETGDEQVYLSYRCDQCGADNPWLD